MIIEILAGALLGVAFLFGARWAGRRERHWYAFGLIVAAVIYVGFALVGAAPLRWTAIELAGVVPYAVFAWLGLRYSAWWLAVGWAAHPAWDVGVHLITGTPVFVPAWYPTVCIGFDLLVAGAITMRVRASDARAAAA